MYAFLVGLAACVLAVWVGVGVAQGELFIATLSALGCAWTVLAWTRGPLAEAWLLGFLIFGYLIGNRGFAQFTPSPGLPLFLSELVLVVAGALMVLRGALARALPLRRDMLNAVLLLWLGLGLARLLWDVRTFGFTALRDFATVYYLLYFFIAQALVRHLPSRQVLTGSLAFTFGLLPFTALLAGIFPDFFRTNLTVHGVPLIFYKDDLLATYLLAGFIYLVPKQRLNLVADRWRWLIALTALLVGLAQLSRAAMVGLAVALGALALAGRWQPTRVVLLAGILGVTGVAAYSTLENRDISQTKVYAIYEHLAAVVDFEGNRSYTNVESADSGANNRFRLVWWRTVWEETTAQAPIFGLGFGYDLARGFVASYNPMMGDDFTVRSPHSIVFTTLGRMGFVGLGVFLLIVITLLSLGLRAAQATRNGLLSDEAITLHAVCWVVLVSACFGVVLEGPMGAIPFWIILALAHHVAQEEPAAEAEPAAAELPAEAATG